VPSKQPVEAAGGFIWRENGGRLEVAVVHRPRYDDWSFPKGKAENDELPLLTAIREVGEETSLSVTPTSRAGRVRYRIEGRDKVVRYWAMHFQGGDFIPNDEVDELEWLDPDAAARRLSYEGDRAVLSAMQSRSLPTSTIILIRHGRAGKREAWTGSDLLRPLDRAGRAQARALIPLVTAFKPERIISAAPLRCLQTVQPLAESLQLRVEIESAFGDSRYLRDRDNTQACLQQLVKSDHVTVVCSQGDTIPGLINDLRPRPPRPSRTAKGAAWVLGCRDAAIISADYYRAPPALRRAR
jgi:8-oxo-dGTP pyrophosphatase MutT (NUDIX family)/phosphohistidine phosphatase SixA